LVGVSLIEIGFDIIIRNALPTYISDFYDKMMQTYNDAIIPMLLNNSNSILRFIIISFCFAITPAVCEEILFRGYLMQNIAQKNSIRKAIILSAIIFALIHFNIVGIIPIFVIGLCLGYLFYYTQSIIPPMILHFINNFFIVLSVNYYYGDEITINSIKFGIISLIIGVIIVLIAFKTLRTNRQYSIKKIGEI
jgi:membrane protease YdiL (CAAX protease family)